MTEDDRVEFAEAIHVLAETFSEPMPALRAEGYFRAMQEFDMPLVNGAIFRAIRECRFFPKPVELRELITGRVEDAAEQAWAAVLKEIRRVGYMGTPMLDVRTLRAVRELWGSWRRMCETLPGEGPELIGWIKQFKEAFASSSREATRQLTAETVHPNVKAFIAREQRKLGA